MLGPMKNIASAALAALLATSFASTALAQDEDPIAGTDGTDEWSDSDPTATSEPETAASSDAPSSSGDAPSMGFATAFPTGGDGGAANILYGMDANTFLNIRFGFDFNKGTVVDPMDPTMTSDATTVGFFAGAGYRMYKDTKGKIRPYLEPGGFISASDFSAFGDTLALGVDAILGVDYALMDQFTLGMGIGGGLTFSNSFKDINLGLFTQSINATFWW